LDLQKSFDVTSVLKSLTGVALAACLALAAFAPGPASAQDKTVRIGFQKYGKLILLKTKGSVEKRLALLRGKPFEDAHKHLADNRRQPFQRFVEQPCQADSTSTSGYQNEAAERKSPIASFSPDGMSRAPQLAP
jgi:hypothetical protein